MAPDGPGQPQTEPRRQGSASVSLPLCLSWSHHHLLLRRAPPPRLSSPPPPPPHLDPHSGELHSQGSPAPTTSTLCPTAQDSPALTTTTLHFHHASQYGTPFTKKRKGPGGRPTKAWIKG
ncbi:hypothetical protein WMY93_027657 [Mugilogobius chulae]|uniref:Uncharacterized protein n=1 Tax=Mugilogobius chulae TaxID=88201 RepID=A0AAW0N0B2_9GOBI